MSPSRSSRQRALRQTMVAARRARRRRRALTALLVLLLLLALLFLRCECREEPPPPPAPPAPAPLPTPPAAQARPRAPGRVATQPRPRFAPERVPAPAWLQELHLQVAARSPRLAACFNGALAPGALRWTAAVNVASGEVSDQAIEPLGASLTAAQRACLTQVLAAPRYRLSRPDDDALASRVSILVEF